MRNHRLFAAGVSVALLLGAASPALAQPGKGKGHAHGHQNTTPADTKPAKPAKPAKDPKAPKTKPGHVNGGGTSAMGVAFSVQARQDKPRQAHFNYGGGEESTASSAAAPASASQVKVRCRNLTFTRVAADTVQLTGQCRATGPGYKKVPASLTATFQDKGATGDVANISVTRNSDNAALVTDNGAIKSGDIKVR